MSEEKKNPPRAQIFRYFRIESRNNKTPTIRLILDTVVQAKKNIKTESDNLRIRYIHRDIHSGFQISIRTNTIGQQQQQQQNQRTMQLQFSRAPKKFTA